MIARGITLTRQEAIAEINERLHAMDAMGLKKLLQDMIYEKDRLGVYVAINGGPLDALISDCQREKAEEEDRQRFLDEHRELVETADPDIAEKIDEELREQDKANVIASRIKRKRKCKKPKFEDLTSLALTFLAPFRVYCGKEPFFMKRFLVLVPLLTLLACQTQQHRYTATAWTVVPLDLDVHRIICADDTTQEQINVGYVSLPPNERVAQIFDNQIQIATEAMGDRQPRDLHIYSVSNGRLTYIIHEWKK